MIVRSWNLRPRPGRYDDSLGLITEGVKLADRHGARTIRLTQAAAAGTHTGLLVLTCEFENLTSYGAYLDDTMMDTEATTYGHRIREAEAPFVYESTALMSEIDLDRPDATVGHGRVLEARYGRPLPGRWDDMMTFTRRAFDLCDEHGAVGCRLFEMDHAGEHTGWLCAVMEYESMRAFGSASDAWLASGTGRDLMETARTSSPFMAISSGIFTEISLF
jgi:hypothetical protein